MKRQTKCTECGGKGFARKIVLDIDNGDGTRTATFGDVRCLNCAGTGFVYETITKYDQFRELDAKALGKLIAKHIPSHACPKEVRELWYSIPPSRSNAAYEEAWVKWLLSPATEPLK